MKINSCETHINRALDEFVAKEETFPSMEPITNEEKLSTTCDYCDTLAVYLVTNT
ncbi:CxxH/CxxC protein [Sporosarcina sp. BI001-red]|uniref:CxxH/CxxC protein n=1 Tax=Sporosarcina sp. BI001-red TaxID=2282866 RepID=UPI000E28131B|nr:CxxH/CxxC protein [Sporosarcina sp. BI001-red]REB08202.1 CxxH/CxxC protein [Sporosarcina sp. BI001-red]